MSANKNAILTACGSDLSQVDAHDIAHEEYDELPELTEDMVARSTLMDGDQIIYSYPLQMITLPLAPDVFERWVATGPGWRERMAELLSKAI